MPHPKIDQQVTFLYTSDLETTAQFYEDVLGLALVLDQGACRIYRVCHDGFLGFCRREDLSPDRSGIIFTFVTSAVDEWYRHLVDNEVEVEKPPEFNPTYNIYHLFFKDPNGYVFEIQAFRDPAWPD
jgi:catechol 2,3-dioxygenase-like lactoylglutathione lyase family enzyme